MGDSGEPASGDERLERKERARTEQPARVGDWLQRGARRLAHSPTPAVDARLLLGYVLGVDTTTLLIHDTAPVAPDDAATYAALLDRAAAQEPIPYLTGTAPFYDLQLRVTPDVLIPRPETEQLVDHALRWGAGRKDLWVVDVGTGSGCIAVTLARHLPLAAVSALDRSAAALQVARTNADRLGVADRLAWVEGDLLEPLLPLDPGGRPLLLTANLPYVSDAEWTELGDGVKSFEPELALRGGADGLDLVRRLLQQVAQSMAQGAAAGDWAIFMEIGWRQGPAAQALTERMLPGWAVTLHKDYAGQDRLITALHQALEPSPQ